MEASADPRLRRTWSVVAPFFRATGDNLWIDDFVEGPWAFRKVPLGSPGDDWHSRSRRGTGAAKWVQYWNQSRRAFPASGVITVFPQPALMVSAQKLLRRRDVPLLAWCFNLGQHPQGLKGAAARVALKGVDRFVVHSTGEIGILSEFLDLPNGKVDFVPLQRAPIAIEASEELNAPFITAMGSANRDYATLFKALEISGLPCHVVASPRALEGLPIPRNVSVEHGLDPAECHRIVQRSRFTVVPLLDPLIASGQVTVVESMRMNKPIIATDSIGTADYIEHRKNGLLVPPHDPETLATAMLELWDDSAERQRYARNAAAFAEGSLSDAAAARALAKIMSELETRP
jgi:glycosyltransferase involved in cell wall biosynthesis